MALHYVRMGKGKKKIVFVHGNMASTRWWQQTMDRLDEEFELLAPDLRGYGQSPAGKNPVGLADHAVDLKGLVETLNFRPFTLVGHSLGGAVAMQFAALYPDLLEGLVLLDAAPVTGMKIADYHAVQMMLDNQQILLAALKATMAKPVDDQLWAGLAEDCIRAIPAVMPNTRALDGADFSADAGKFPNPVLVIHGELDRVVPLAEAEKTAAAYPQSKLVILYGAGHSAQMDDNDAFVKHLRQFVASLKITRGLNRGDF